MVEGDERGEETEVDGEDEEEISWERSNLGHYFGVRRGGI